MVSLKSWVKGIIESPVSSSPGVRSSTDNGNNGVTIRQCPYFDTSSPPAESTPSQLELTCPHEDRQTHHDETAGGCSPRRLGEPRVGVAEAPFDCPRTFRANLGVAQTVQGAGVVPRRQVRHLGTLDRAVRPRAGRLVRTPDVHTGQ